MNDITQFALSRPFHRGKKDKDNEFAVSYGTLCHSCKFAWHCKGHWMDLLAKLGDMSRASSIWRVSQSGLTCEWQVSSMFTESRRQERNIYVSLATKFVARYKFFAVAKLGDIEGTCATCLLVHPWNELIGRKLRLIKKLVFLDFPYFPRLSAPSSSSSPLIEPLAMQRTLIFFKHSRIILIRMLFAFYYS